MMSVTFVPVGILFSSYKSSTSILYFLYQTLCEGVHGRGIHYAMHQQAKELEEYRRSIMQVYLFCKDILLILDKEYLSAHFKKEVLSAVAESDNLIKESIHKN